MDVASSSNSTNSQQNKLTPSTSLPNTSGGDKQVLANSRSAELRPESNDLSFKPDPPKRTSVPPSGSEPPAEDRKKSRAVSESGESTNNNTPQERNNNDMNRGEDETVPLLQKPSISSMNEPATRPASSSSNTSCLRTSAVNTPTPPPSGGQVQKRVGINEPPTSVASALPNRFAHHKRLKKYASETSFGLSPGAPIVPRQLARIDPIEPPPANSQPSSRNNSDAGGHDVRTPGRVFHVRTTGPNYQQASRTAGNGSTVANKVHRRRQDSDDASGSVGSETTVASGTITPVSRRMLRFKLRRPKSTGSMGNQQDTLGQGDTYHSTGNPYDPSFTSATIHSLESNQQQIFQDVEERRASNFYIFDDDSTHEFDDEVQAIYGLHAP
ncbi:unnamed protein product [Bursaphelenchus okinawaensis]|uniref:Uncharacterized protein n=1 Tax=Bursaphelenchus okinawaensis TaxID=465554 RepID=A0A811K1Z6_9BILA|nr:unnamed protein product [Bursaphelenchus okinawaensis]CAG9088712.1 unnamed protein product [Bursaphelenchus okinawaensis]